MENGAITAETPDIDEGGERHRHAIPGVSEQRGIGDRHLRRIVREPHLTLAPGDGRQRWHRFVALAEAAVVHPPEVGDLRAHADQVELAISYGLPLSILEKAPRKRAKRSGRTSRNKAA